MSSAPDHGVSARGRGTWFVRSDVLRADIAVPRPPARGWDRTATLYSPA